MVFAYLILLGLVVGVAYVGIPTDLRKTINENCRNSEGQLRRRYVVREAKALLAFYAQILFAASLVGFVVLVALMMVDSYVVPLDFVKNAALAADVDVHAWKERLDTTQVRTNSSGIHGGRSGSWATARDSMRLLWHGLPFAIMASFIAIVICLRASSQGYNNALSDLVLAEDARCRRRMTRRYLDRAAESRQRRSAHRSRAQQESIQE